MSPAPVQVRSPGGATETTQTAILLELQQKLEAFPSDFPDAAVLAKVEAVRALLAGTLTVAGSVEVANDAGNPLGVSDDYATEAHAVDQEGADGVLTFTVTAGKMVMVDVDPVLANDVLNYRARATCNGTTPSATSGFVCRPGTSYLPVPTTGTVKVWAPAGVVVSVQTVAR